VRHLRRATTHGSSDEPSIRRLPVPLPFRACLSSSGGLELADSGDSDEAVCPADHVWINRGEGVGLQSGDREVLSLSKGSPSTLACNLPGGATRDSVAQQAHPELGQLLVAGPKRKVRPAPSHELSVVHAATVVVRRPRPSPVLRASPCHRSPEAGAARYCCLDAVDLAAGSRWRSAVPTDSFVRSASLDWLRQPATPAAVVDTSAV
jgi:hypothetical protein